MVGKLHIAGMKAEEAAALIRQKFIDGAYLKDPQVTIFIAEYATQNVSVLGEVKNPGIYPAFGAHHLLDYISAAQGLTPLAGTRITITHAANPTTPKQVKVTSGATPKPENNPEVLPGDTVYVERTGVIFVVGDVMRPGGYPMDHDGQLSILQAIALAQGTNPTAAKSSAKLIRTTTEGRQEIAVNLKEDSAVQVHRPGYAGQRHSLHPQQRRQERNEGHRDRLANGGRGIDLPRTVTKRRRIDPDQTKRNPERQA